MQFEIARDNLGWRARTVFGRLIQDGSFYVMLGDMAPGREGDEYFIPL